MSCPRSTQPWGPGVTDMQSRFTLLGAEHSVWLSRSADGYRLHVGASGDGLAISLSRGATGGTDRVLTVEGVGTPVVVAQRDDQVFIHLDGRAYALDFLDPVRSLGEDAAGAGENDIRAPMPGVVISVPIRPGDTVAAGDVLVVIESMKVQTTLRAGLAATVLSVHVAEGQTFDRDHVLVTLRAAS